MARVRWGVEKKARPTLACSVSIWSWGRGETLKSEGKLGFNEKYLFSDQWSLKDVPF